MPTLPQNTSAMRGFLDLKPHQRFIFDIPPLPTVELRAQWPLAHRFDQALKAEMCNVIEEYTVFGLELRTSHLVEIGWLGLDVLDCTYPGNRVARRSLTTLFLRPAVEPVILTLLRNWHVDQRFPWRRLGQILNPAAPIRRGPLNTTKWPNGSYCVYPYTSRNHQWEDDLEEVLALSLPSFVRGLLLYGLIVAHHPLEDGNGRLARAAIWVSLFKDSQNVFPCIPIAPCFLTNPSWFESCCRALAVTGDWESYIERALQLVSVLENLPRTHGGPPQGRRSGPGGLEAPRARN